MKKNDIILIVVFLIIAAAGYILLSFTADTGDHVVVTVNKKEVYNISLNEDTELEIPLTDGKNTIIIKNGEVSMKEADCPDQICVKHKAISKSGESIVCLPHKVIVEIVNEENSDVDIMTQ